MRILAFSRSLTAVLVAWVCVAGQFAAPTDAQSSSQLQPLDFPGMMKPIPVTAAFSDPGYFVWGGTLVQGNDGNYHLYYSRWKQSFGFESWVTHSEIAHAVGNTPEGPFHFHDVALGIRGQQFWDGLVAHNPTIHRFGGRYYLYYMGNTGDGKVLSTLNWVHRNNQRIGVAVADDPNGPWLRFDRPLIDVSSNRDAADSLCVANPSITQGRDGRYYLLYKAVGLQKTLPFGGPVVHLMAVGDSPVGPFRKIPKPLFTIPGNNFPFEDPYFWFDRRRDHYFALLKDNHGTVSGLGHSSLILYQSSDAEHWEKAPHWFVSDLALHWRGRPVEPVERMERPQLAFDDYGNPTVLLVAIRQGGEVSYNVRIPLVSR